jgi:hypothetical protein
VSSLPDRVKIAILYVLASGARVWSRGESYQSNGNIVIFVIPDRTADPEIQLSLQLAGFFYDPIFQWWRWECTQ